MDSSLRYQRDYPRNQWPGWEKRHEITLDLPASHCYHSEGPDHYDSGELDAVLHVPCARDNVGR